MKSLSKYQDSLIEKLSEIKKEDIAQIDITEKENLQKELISYEKESYVDNIVKGNPEESNETISIKENITKTPAEDIIIRANNRVDKIQNNIDKIEEYSIITFEKAKQKVVDAEVKGQEAQKLIAKANTTSNTATREESLKKAEGLKKDSAILIQESIVDKNVSLLISDKIKVQKNSLDSVLPYLKLIDDYAESNNIQKEQEIYNELTKKLESKVFDIQNFQQKVASEISTTAYNKIRKSNSLISEAKKLETSAYKANDEVNKLKNEEANAENEESKEKIHNSYIQKQQIADSISETVKEKYREGNQLKIEATALKTQIEYAVSIIKKSTSQTSISSKQLADSEKIKAKSKDGEKNTQQIADNTFQKPAIGNQQPAYSNQKISESTIEKKKDSVNLKISQPLAVEKKTEIINSSSISGKQIAEKEIAVAKQIEDFKKANADNQVKYVSIKNESKEIKAKIDTVKIKDTAVKIYEYEAEYYFKQATITKNKADSTKNNNVKAKLLKDANIL